MFTLMVLFMQACSFVYDYNCVKYVDFNEILMIVVYHDIHPQAVLSLFTPCQ